MFGHPILNEHIHTLVKNRHGVKTALADILELLKMVKEAWLNDSRVRKITDLTRTLDIKIQPNDSMKTMYVKIDSCLEHMVDIYNCHMHISGTSIFYQIVAMIILVENNPDFNMEHYTDIAELLSSCQNVISAEIPQNLEDIAQTLKNKMADFARIEINGASDWLKNNCHEAWVKYEGFIEKHGHRGFKEVKNLLFYINF